MGKAGAAAPATPARVVIAGTSLPGGVLAGSLAVLAAVAYSYAGIFELLAHTWWTEADYSHGFLVPVFSAYLLWHRRSLLPTGRASGAWWGLVLIAVAGAMRWGSTYFFYPLLAPVSLLPCLLGVALLAGGVAAAKWSWPAILFLIFMIPLPGALAGLLSNPLQTLATNASTWLLQTLGMPAIARGNVILLAKNEIGVVDACSGLRMLMLFTAITVGASFVIDRPLWEKVLISLSAMAIGLVVNILRITVTAFAYEYVGKKLGDLIFHDLAGWLMMPAATLLLMLELFVLSKILVAPPGEGGPLLMER